MTAGSAEQRGTAMSLYGLKPIWLRLLRNTEESLVGSGVSANLLTAATVPLSLLTGAAIAVGSADRVLWVLVPILMLARVAVAALDGAIARRTGTAGPRGFAFNELADRLADVALLGAGYVVTAAPIATAALVFVLGAEFVGVVIRATGADPSAVGPLAMPGRFVILGGAALVAIAWADAFTVAYLLIALGSAVTFGARLRTVFRHPLEAASAEERI